MISSKPKVSAEELRIEASNKQREIAKQRDYVTDIRSDIHASRENIKRMTLELAQLNEALKRRVERLETAEAKLRKMDPSR